MESKTNSANRAQEMHMYELPMYNFVKDLIRNPREQLWKLLELASTNISV